MEKNNPTKFMTGVEVNAETGCWLWRRALGKTGYGQVSIGNKMTKAHRLAWIFFRGGIPPGVHVLHKCDVRRCVNPEHLYLGSHADNMRDKMARGGQACGTQLSDTLPDTVRAIRAAIGTVPEIARKFGMSHGGIWSIRSRRTWKHLS